MYAAVRCTETRNSSWSSLHSLQVCLDNCSHLQKWRRATNRMTIPVMNWLFYLVKSDSLLFPKTVLGLSSSMRVTSLLQSTSTTKGDSTGKKFGWWRWLWQLWFRQKQQKSVKSHKVWMMTMSDAKNCCNSDLDRSSRKAWKFLSGIEKLTKLITHLE